MFDLISIGSISIDLYFRGTHIPTHDDRLQLAVGGKYMADYFYEGVGGGGVNVAIGVSKLGHRTALVGKIGKNSFKTLIQDTLRKSDVSMKFCQYEKGYINISTILLGDSGERSIIHFLPPHGKILEANESVHLLAATKSVYMGGLPDVEISKRISLLKQFRRAGVLTVLNLGVTDCRRSLDELEALLQCTDILIVNGHEFADLVKSQHSSLTFDKNFVQKYRFLQNTILLITEGNQGSYGYTNTRIYKQKAVHLRKILDTTGCGDGYTAGFISEYLKDRNVEDSMKAGARYASQILAQIGAN